MTYRRSIEPSDFGLSGREQAVLRLLCEGQSNKMLARELKIRESTVKAHVTRIIKLIGCQNRTQAALLGFCMERRLHEQTLQLLRKLDIKPPRPTAIAGPQADAHVHTFEDALLAT